ncbi:general transcription factor IIH subunit 4 isoform X2 [Nasonia vitripennis]|uniref:General transcription factor IIH subunit 4 n=1 Tax=Nasonia vitripennis TaxID=7425 RepID=A0A7M7GCX3_NASVI|nr:general transcription factor IIH subunit 4 isoform X2 [Nasonia vitripennis]XP_031782632.1 general transcription factor IIH subunit 4 isoform X2 [Nasonia vitripennis]XP_031782633.1 general transcription factor IIH subunit 4 isoform X2 [Nasonia vitripennis]
MISAISVYRELPEIARHYVMRLLFVEQPVPQAVIASWCSKLHVENHLNVVQVMNELNIWKEAAIPGGLPGWILNATFRKNLKIVLLGGGAPWTMSKQLEIDSKPRDIAFLDSYALERWECVLHYMVGSQQQEGISADAVRILLHAGLMKRDEEDGSPVITQAGFQFLLLDTSAQVWYFILQYLDTVEARGLDLVECLTFLFQLNFSTLGKDYSTQGMSDGLLMFLQHLREFGLVYQRKRKAGRFYPTRLALNIATGQDKPISRDLEKERFVIVETNYRVYAYTNSNLQVALIGLFCELLYRFPNLVVAILTRDSVRAALKSGITAVQIVGYLNQHAHNKMIDPGPPTLPPTIVDQIKLWENERNRFIFSEGVLYSQFHSQIDFEVLRDHAVSLGVMIWQSDRKRTMVVTKTGHDDVKKFWKRYSKGAN